MASQTGLGEIFVLLGREQRLSNAGIYLHRAEAFFDSDGRIQTRANGLANSLCPCIAPIVIGCAENCDLKALLPDADYHVFRFPKLGFPLRRQLWQRELVNAFSACNGADVDALANQFVLTGGQIREAVQSARNNLRLREKVATLPSNADLFAAARKQSQHVWVHWPNASSRSFHGRKLKYGLLKTCLMGDGLNRSSGKFCILRFLSIIVLC